MPTSGENPYFREMPSVEFWSASIVVDREHEDTFKQALLESARETGFTFSGFFVDEAITENSAIDQQPKRKYIYTRYPRHKYGINSIDECNRSLQSLTEHLHNSDVLYDIGLDPRDINPAIQYRVIIGKEEGYNTAVVHTEEEYNNFLGDGYSITNAQIYVAGPEREYSEEAVVVDMKNADQLQKVYDLADTYNQARFTVEDLVNGFAQVVETRHAIPDPEPNL